jgi:hypothetical protein
MSELDQGLNKAVMETIWINKIDPIVKERVHPYWFEANGQTFTFGVDTKRIIGIMQKASQLGNNIDIVDKVMTGPEWYAAFEKELDMLMESWNPNGAGFLDRKLVGEAARRASGIEEKQDV